MDINVENLAKLTGLATPKENVNLSNIDFYSLASASPDNIGLSEFESDLKNLDYVSLINKYNKEDVDAAIQAQLSGASNYIYDNLQNRDTLNIAKDTAVGIGQGVVGSVGGLLGLGASALNEDLGTAIAQGTNNLTQGLQELKSDELQRMQRAYNARSTMLDRESEALYQKDLREGSSLRANLRKLGRDVLNTASNIASEGAIAGDIAAQGAGSILVGGPTSKAVRGLAEAAQLAKAKALGNLNSITRAQIAKNTAEMNAWVPTTMALEGGGGYASGVQDVMDMPLSTLNQNPDFVSRVQELINQNVPESEAIEQARMELADSVGKSTAGIAAVTAAGLSKFSKWAEAPFKPNTLSGRVGNVASETFEESAQGVGTQMGQNLAVQLLADANRNIVDDVGRNIVEGAVGGALSSGAINASGLALAGLGKAGSNAASILGSINEGKSLIKDNTTNTVTQTQGLFSEDKNTQKIATAFENEANNLTKLAETEDNSEVTTKETEVHDITAPQDISATTETLEPVSNDEDTANISETATSEGNIIQTKSSPKELLNKVIFLDNDILPKLSNTTKALIGNNPQKTVALLSLMDSLTDTDADDATYIDLLQDYYTLSTSINDVVNSEEYKNLPKSNITQSINKFIKYKEAFESDPNIIEKVNKATQKVDDAQWSSAPSVAIKATRAMLTINPLKAREENLHDLEKGIKEGSITLSSKEAKSLQVVFAILDQKKKYLNSLESKNLTNVNKVTENIFTLEADKSTNKKQSISSHLSNLLRAINNNNYIQIEEEIQRLNKWGVAFKNKVDALNKSIELAKTKGIKDEKTGKNLDLSVDYDSYNPNLDKVYSTSIYVNPASSNSVGLASVVLDEYNALAAIYKAISNTYKVSLKELPSAPRTTYLNSLISKYFGDNAVTIEVKSEPEGKTDTTTSNSSIETQTVEPQQSQQQESTESIVQDQEVPPWEDLPEETVKEPEKKVEQEQKKTRDISDIPPWEDLPEDLVKTPKETKDTLKEPTSEVKSKKNTTTISTKTASTNAQGTRADPIYAGIGSRKTPKVVLDLMVKIGKVLGEANWTLRSGGAKGADSAFEYGARKGKKEIYYANDIARNTYSSAKEALDTVDKYHPASNRLTPYAKNLLARDAYQILGKQLQINSNIVITYTPISYNGDFQGGSGQALRIAKDKDIPILNLYDLKTRREVEKHIKDDTLPAYIESLSKFNEETSLSESTSKKVEPVKEEQPVKKDPNFIEEEIVQGVKVRVYKQNKNGNFLVLDKKNNTINIYASVIEKDNSVSIVPNLREDVLKAIGINKEQFESFFTSEEDTINFLKNFGSRLLNHLKSTSTTPTTRDFASIVIRSLPSDKLKALKESFKIQSNEKDSSKLKEQLHKINEYFNKFRDKLFIKSLLRRPVNKDSGLISVNKTAFDRLERLGITLTKVNTKKSYYGLIDPNELQTYLDSLKIKKPDYSAAISEIISELVSPAQSIFKKRFKLNPTSNISILNTDSPIEDSIELVKNNLNKDVASAYEESLTKFVTSVKETLNQNINSIIKKNSKLIDDLETSTKYNNRKTLVFLTQDENGNYRYNDRILDSILTAVHLYLLNNPTRAVNKDYEEIIRDFGLNNVPSSEWASWANKVTEKTTLVNSISNMVIRNTGLDFNTNVPESISKDAIRALILDVLTAASINSSDLVKITLSPTFSSKYLNSYEEGKDFDTNFYGFIINSPVNLGLSVNSSRILELINPEETPNVYLNNNIPLADRSDKKSGLVYSDKVRKAIQNRNAVSYYLDKVHTAWLKALGRENAVILNTSNIPEKYRNINFKKSQDGVATLINSSFDTFELDVAQRQLESDETGIPLYEVSKHYPTRTTSVSRFQENDPNGPVANKMTREYSVVTKDVLDLSKYTPGDISTREHALYTIALGQAFGIKVHNIDLENSSQELKKIIKDARPVIDWFKNWLSSIDVSDLNSVKPLSKTEILKLKKLFEETNNSDISPSVELVKKALMDIARLELEQENNTANKHETSMYLEADGVTNGTANALVLFYAGEVNEQYIANLARVGVSIGVKRPLKDLRKIYPKDMYAIAGEKLGEDLNRAIERGKYTETRKYLDKLMNLIEFSTDPTKFKVPEKNSVIFKTFTFARNFIKNPFTVVNYGSGTRGISQKVLNDSLYGFLPKFYKQLSLANYEANTLERYKDMKFEDAFKLALFKETDLNIAKQKFDFLAESLYELGNIRLGYSKKKDKTYVDNRLLPSNQQRKERIADIKTRLLEPTTFTAFNSFIENENAENNIQVLLTGQMGETFSELVGNDLTNTLNTLQTSTEYLSQLHKLFFGLAYLRYLRDNPDGLSVEDLNSLKEDFKELKAVYNTTSGEVSLYKEKVLQSTESKTLSTLSIKKSKLDSKNSSGTSIIPNISTSTKIPNSIGVAAKPLFTIANGDAEMMFILSDISDALAVFDGFNMPISKIDNYNIKANKAVHDSWNNNEAILKAVEKFDKAIGKLFQILEENYSLTENISNLARTSEEKVLINEVLDSIRKSTDDKVESKQLISLVENLIFYRNTLINNAKYIKARLDAFKTIGLSVDQLAGSENAFITENINKDDLIKLGIPEEVIDGLNDPQLYTESATQALNILIAKNLKELSKLNLFREKDISSYTESVKAFKEQAQKKREAKAVEQLNKEIVAKTEEAAKTSVGSTILNSIKKSILISKGSRESFEITIENFINKLPKPIRTNFLQLKLNPNTKIYVGDKPNLLRVLNNEGATVSVSEWIGLCSNKTSNVFILVDKDNPISNRTAITVLHELIHASTINTIRKLCLNSPETKEEQAALEAMNGIIGLAEQLVDMMNNNQVDISKDPLLSELIQTTGIIYNNETSQWELPDLSKPNLKAQLIEEFIAIGLTERPLIDILKKIKVTPKVHGLFGKLRLFIKKFFLAGFKFRVPSKFYDNLVWATNIISYANGSGYSNMNSAPSTIFGSSINTKMNQDDSVSLADKYKISLKNILKKTKDMGITAYARKNKDILKENIKANTLLERAMLLGFTFTDAEKEDFKTIFTALKAGATIPTISKIKLQKIFENIVEKLHPEDFLEETDLQDQGALMEANRKLDFIKGIYQDDVNIKDALPLLIALSSTNEEVRNILSKMEIPSTIESNSNLALDRYLDKIGNDITDKLVNFISDTKDLSSISDVIALIANQVDQSTMENEIAVTNKFDETYMKLGNKANNFLLEARDVIGEKLWKSLSDTEKEVSNKFAKKCIKFLKDLTEILTKYSLENFKSSIIKILNDTNINVDLKTLIKDIIGNDAKGGRIEAIVKQTKAFVQRVRMQYRELAPHIFKRNFKEATEEDWKLMYKAFAKTDIAVISEGIFNNFVDLFRDPNEVSKRINELEKNLKNSYFINAKLYIEKSKELALYMMTGKVSPNLLRNSTAIAYLLGEDVDHKTLKITNDLQDTIDKLVSLYSIQYLSKEETNRIVELSEQNPKAVKMILGNLRDIRSKDIAKDSNKSRFNGIKGYMPSVAKNKGKIVLDENDPETRAKYEQLGYVYLKDYDSDIPGVFLGYYSFPINTNTMYQQGGFQNVNISSRGINTYTGFSVDPFVKIITDKTIVKLYEEDKFKSSIGMERAIPVYNDEQKLIAIELAGDPDAYKALDRDTDLANMLGVYLGRLKEEDQAINYNDELAKELFEQYKNASLEDKNSQFINLYESKDPIIQDSLTILSESAKDSANAYFGPGFLPVRKDMVEEVIGVRRASIGDFWTGKSRWSPEVQKTIRKVAESILGKGAYRKLLNFENLIQTGMAEARNLIVVKSLVVSYFNIVSNVINLIGNGVPPIYIYKNIVPKLIEIENYNKQQLKLIELDIKINAIPPNYRARVELEKERDFLKDSLNDSTIGYLINKGEFSTISDIGTTTEDLNISSDSYLDELNEKINSLPEIPKTITKYGIISKDTSFYKFASKSVQYSDFIAKAILFDFLVKVKKYSKEEAANTVRDEFVNYDLSSGRTRGFLESTGILWFWNYRLRISRTALKMIARNPFYALLMFGITLPFDTLSSPLDDNILSKGILGELGFSIGVEQAISAPTLNPYINIFNS